MALGTGPFDRLAPRDWNRPVFARIPVRRLTSNWRPARGDVGAPRAGRPIERPLRLATGLILFGYATSHLVNHAFGIRSVEAFQAAGLLLLKPWQSVPGRLVLYTAFFVHCGLGLYAVYRRRHLRIPPGELWQLALGLAIPLLLIPHAAAIAIGKSTYGLEFGYPRVLYEFWVASPDLALPRQYLLLVVVWIHGCIGIRSWLQSKPWYPRAAAPLASLASLVPALALIGFTNAGLNLRDAAKRDPTAAAARYVVARPGTVAEQNYATTIRITDAISLVYLSLLGGTFGFRVLRDWHARRFQSVRITYPDGRVVTVPSGFSVLEASRWAAIPHASVCGGRCRCSTCRVRIVACAEGLGGPAAAERQTLIRIGAPKDVRLACQLRPTTDLTIELLVHPNQVPQRGAARFGAAIEGGHELEIAALFVDLRDSTRLATNRLPYDALFLFDRYIQAVTAAVRQNMGHVTSIAGDGVMSVFGAEGDIANATRGAWKAALQIWSALDALNEELAGELSWPLRVGMGLHLGVAVVGLIGTAEDRSLQFLGDTGNVAAKLEEQTRPLEGVLVASTAALARIAVPTAGVATTVVSIAGREIPVAVFRRQSELQHLIAAADWGVAVSAALRTAPVS
jgi:adenylate cyclase